MTSFPMPIGPKADLAELEYIAALHQTDFPNLRNDASISVSDISLYLRSRYGLRINSPASLDIVRGLGGTQCRRREEGNVSDHEVDCVHAVSNLRVSKGREAEMLDNLSFLESQKMVQEIVHSGEKDKDDRKQKYEEEYLDMVEWIAALFIPTILKASNDADSCEYLDSEIRRIQRELQDCTDNLTTGDLADSIKRMWKIVQSQRDLQIIRDKKSLEIDRRLIPFAFQSLMQSLGIEDEGSNEDVVLTKDLVRRLLLAHGEIFHEDLLLQMVDCATSDEAGDVENPQLFNISTFTAALTHDINKYECGVEDKLSTTFFDVFNFEPTELDKSTTMRDAPGRTRNCVEDNENRSSNHNSSNSLSDLNPDEEGGGEEVDLNSKYEGKSQCLNCKTSFTYVPTAPYLDYVVDSQHGVVFLMFLWVYFIFSVAVYMIFVNYFAYNIFECSPTFSCELGNRIWSWMNLGIILSLGGLILMVPISMANDPYRVHWLRPAISATFILGFTFLPYAGITWYKDGIPHQQSPDLDMLLSTRWVEMATDIYLSFGVFLLLTCTLKYVIGIIFDHKEQEQLGRIGRLFLSRDITGSAGIKLAATRKMNRLLVNVLALHNSDHDKNLSQRFLLSTEQLENCAGILWTWKQMLNGNRLLQDNGVWIHSRLAVGQEGQIIVYAFVIGLLSYSTGKFAQGADELVSLVQQEETGPLKSLLLSYLPTGKIIKRSFSTGIGFAAAIGIILILVYLPSAVSTTLKLRTGVLSSMYDKDFHKYRYSADTTFYNVGNMVFGLAGSMFLFFLFFGGLVFLCLWQITREEMILILAWFTALMITILLHYLLTRVFRKKFYTSFYRQQPRAGNFSALAMECWHIGLGGGVLIGRLTQFLLASAFWIGRIDVSFLHEDVHIFGYRFDTAPINFRKEILVHEAHRHPYIDRLGAMYLMRLKHGQNFCTDAGCAWRHLFILALMPWLMKYRLKHTEREEGSSVVANENGSVYESDKFKYDE